MPRYYKLGDIPSKRHTVFKSKNGDFYYEELFGTIGFDGMSSLMYHTQRPTQVKEILNIYLEYETFTIEIYDIIGKKIFEAENLNSINVKHLEEGIYLLKISSGNYNQSKLFIKK